MGRGGWQDERPTRATVRHLYGDEAKGSGATTSEEWYETERLTGQITGRRDAPAIDQPAPLQSEALAVLDWRHADSAPAPTVLQRLGRSLADRRHRIASSLVLAGHRSHQPAAPGTREAAAGSQPHARRSRLAMLTTRRAVAHGTAEAGEDEQTADEVLTAELSSRRADPRGSGDLAPQRLDWRSAPAPKPRRERRDSPVAAHADWRGAGRDRRGDGCDCDRVAHERPLCELPLGKVRCCVVGTGRCLLSGCQDCENRSGNRRAAGTDGPSPRSREPSPCTPAQTHSPLGPALASAPTAHFIPSSSAKLGGQRLPDCDGAVREHWRIGRRQHLRWCRARAAARASRQAARQPRAARLRNLQALQVL